MSDQSPVEEALGAEFWSATQGALEPEFDLIRTLAATALRAEVRDRTGSALDFMLIERLAFMYAYLRQAEATEGTSITALRSLQKDWLDLATNMKKIWNAEVKDNQQEILLKKVDKSIGTVFEQLPDTPEYRNIKKMFAESFQANGV